MTLQRYGSSPFSEWCESKNIVGTIDVLCDVIAKHKPLDGINGRSALGTTYSAAFGESFADAHTAGADVRALARLMCDPRVASVITGKPCAHTMSE